MAKLDDLTPRELRYLSLIALGLTAREAAAILGDVTPKAVYKGLEETKRKLGARTLPHAVFLACGGNRLRRRKTFKVARAAVRQVRRAQRVGSTFPLHQHSAQREAPPRP